MLEAMRQDDRLPLSQPHFGGAPIFGSSTAMKQRVRIRYPVPQNWMTESLNLFPFLVKEPALKLENSRAWRGRNAYKDWFKHLIKRVGR